MQNGKAIIGKFFKKYKDAEKYGKQRNKLIYDYRIITTFDGYIVISKKQAQRLY
jgi:hypothetical protein